MPSDATEAYCKQIVSEARVRKQGGGYTWVQTSRDNHFLDAESLAYAAAFMLGVTRMSDDKAKYILQEREREGLTASDDDGVNREKPEPKFAKDTWFGAGPGARCALQIKEKVGNMSRDPWMNAGDFGHPNKKSDSIRFASDSWWSSDRGELRANNESEGDGLHDRAERALTFGRRDHRLARLWARFSKALRW